MNRASALLTWWYLAIGGIVAVVALAVPMPAVRESLYLVAAVQLVPVVFYSWRHGLISGRMAGISAAAGVLYALARFVSGDGPTYATPLAVALGLAATGCILGGLTALVRKSGVDAHPGLLGDSVTVVPEATTA